MAQYFEALIADAHAPKLCVTWLTVELLGRLKNGVTIEESPVNSAKLNSLLTRIEDGTISQKAAKDVLDYLMEHDESVDALIEKLGLKQVSDDGAIIAIIDAVLAANADKVAEYKSGKDKLFGFFMGQVMKETKGKANPKIAMDILVEELN